MQFVVFTLKLYVAYFEFCLAHRVLIYFDNFSVAAPIGYRAVFYAGLCRCFVSSSIAP